VYERGSGAGFGFEAAERGFPHSPQNFIPAPFSKPQLAHFDFSDAPHSPQNFMPLAFSKAQAGQRIDGTRGRQHPRPLPYGDTRNGCTGRIGDHRLQSNQRSVQQQSSNPAAAGAARLAATCESHVAEGRKPVPEAAWKRKSRGLDSWIPHG
jgi:hypothetical protein